jgi:hypothetical protein
VRVILNEQGRIRWTHVEEGLCDEQENVVKRYSPNSFSTVLA